MQGDQLSLASVKLLPHLQSARSDHPLAAAAQAQLRDFDGVMGAERVAPLLLWAWSRQLTLDLFTEKVGGAKAMHRLLGGRNLRDALEGVLERQDEYWCPPLAGAGLSGKPPCQARIDAAFTRTLEELQAQYGQDVTEWRWGRAHQARSEHRPFSQVPLLAKLFEVRVPVGGDTYSVNAARVSLRPDSKTGEVFVNEHGPSLRAIYDLGDPQQSRFIHSTGQSGLPFSKHYRDLVAPWAAVKDLPLWGDGQPGRVLTLAPAP